LAHTTTTKAGKKFGPCRRLRTVWVALAIFSPALTAFAQHPQYLPAKVGVWKPLRMTCDGSGRGLTAEQNRVYSAKLRKISEAIHQSEVFNPPMGIEARPTGCVNATVEFLDDYPGNQKGPIPGYLMVGTFSYAYYSGTTKVEVADEGPHFFVDVNSLVRLYSDSGEIARDQDGKIFPLAQESRAVRGLPTYNGSIIITRNTKPIFLPVSVQSFLQARIKQAQTELAKLQAEHQKQSGEYNRWLACREKREQERQKAYQNMKLIAPQNADNYLRISEDGERKRGEMLKADADNAGTPTPAEQFKQKELNGYQTELASLSSQQRAAQAWYSWDYRQGQALLANPGERNARPLVRFNPDFFDRSRPRTAIQSLVVGRLYDSSYREKSYDPQYQRIIDFRKNFDFQSLVSLLDK
jgi:hypothetical protein